TAQNPDDSGDVRYRATTPVAGLQFRPRDNLRLYVSYGNGFETPSYNELGYRSDAHAGLAFDLSPARSHNMEAGLKWRFARAVAFDAAAFRSDTRDELAVATNQNGRSTYRNVGGTRRQGMEFSVTGELHRGWRLSAGFTHLQARFRDGFLACTSTPCGAPSAPVKAGSRLPGVPSNYGSLRLEHGHTLGWRGGVTLSGVGSVTVNDIGSQRATGYGLVGLDVSRGFALGERAQLQLSARV
ncbi:MAG: TonB-dependent receptor domain-containing protein, partial [Rhodanobacter sp.]